MIYVNDIIQKDMVEIRNQEIPFEKLKNKSILLTGAGGMLASYLVYFFMYLNEKENYGINVFALVRNEEKAWEKFGEFKNKENFKLIVQDVCDVIKLSGKIDYIIHAAGNASPHFILKDPVGIIKANTIGTINVMECAKQNQAKVLYMSTREVYGKVSDEIVAISETDFGVLDPIEQRACYPESKRIAESIIQSYFYQEDVESIIVRIAHSYGPGMIIENDGRVMSDFISDIVNNRNIVLKSSGEAERAFCYITDALSGILLAFLSGKSGEAYNLANETEPFPIKVVAEKLVQLFPEKALKVEFDIPKEMNQGYSKMGRTMLNTNKLEKLGWKPRVSLEEGMKRTVLSFENSNNECI